MARLFRLLRCGRLEAARQLCQHVGQPWRAASLGSSGGMGLTPLGALRAWSGHTRLSSLPTMDRDGIAFKHIQAWQCCKAGIGYLDAGEAAEDADAAPEDRTAEQLCSETELGLGTLRALWRWASFQVRLMLHSRLPMKEGFCCNFRLLTLQPVAFL